MSHAATPTSTSGLVRVTVASGTRRVDLVLPGSVPVAELVPELARSVGLLDAATVHGGYRVITQDGRPLAGDAGLTMQGVRDGGLLTVAAGVDDAPPRVYDDVVEAMADAVERDLKPWEPAAGRRTALTAAVLLLGLGAFALHLQRGSTVAAVASAIIAALLVVGAVVLSHAQREREAAICLAWTGAGYAAVAGRMLVPDGDLFGYPVAAAGVGAMLAGIVCVVGLRSGRALVIPAVVVGSICAAVGLVMTRTTVDAAVVFTTVLVLVVVVGSVLPWLALGVTGTNVEQIYSHADITREPTAVDPGVVREDALVGHEILLAVSATVGALLVLTAPLAVTLGLAGTLIAVASSAVVMLRTRQYRTGSEVMVGLASGILGLVTTAGAVLVVHPDWRATVAVVLAAAGALLLTGTFVPGSASVRRGRLADVAEVTALVALVPLLVLAVGLYDRVRG
ncbi:type VII secretion integral membrane protein EccD [Nocardioides guangzhouensis]|uniref:Type VII secretion integral membrane protein EccD n=1 Tax=Nocardioides guangzhouensis TaxID=2497878 RepID=A0A4Q4ZGB3_9ACTN|nr:type VII secretion integral membrane protein EccD [Nocardioides guangzhouensis]RYP87230.1 type VII secretion integral membrane protein EccD [Nocardioides guangzhouensis]